MFDRRGDVQVIKWVEEGAELLAFVAMCYKIFGGDARTRCARAEQVRCIHVLHVPRDKASSFKAYTL